MTGWAQPWPLQWGGGPTPIETMLEALKAAVGKGHPADNDGFEHRRREAHAVGLGCLSVLADRAANQSYPLSSADLSFWRAVYFLPDSMLDEEARREAHFRFLDDDTVSVPDLNRSLKRIDSRFEVRIRSWDESYGTIIGRRFESFTGSPPFSLPGGESHYPNVSSQYELVVDYVIGDGVSPTGETEQKAIRLARDYLLDALPSWYTFAIVTTGTLRAGVTPLGWTTL